MTMCALGGQPCCCQPDEGVACPFGTPAQVQAALNADGMRMATEIERLVQKRCADCDLPNGCPEYCLCKDKPRGFGPATDPVHPAPSDDGSGNCTVCGCVFEDPRELTHECPPGFVTPNVAVEPLAEGKSARTAGYAAGGETR